MITLGELERAVMDVLWADPRPLAAREVLDRLPGRDLAVTTVLTVLSRLEHKKMVSRSRDGRAHRYRATYSREQHTAALMHQVLAGSPDTEAVLSRFVGSASSGEVEALRRLLDGLPRRD